MKWLLIAAVLINEVQSSNDSTCTDEKGKSPDWIELYNSGAEDVDLSGWGLSDKQSKPYKWTFPSGTIISAGGYLKVYADSTTGEISSDQVVALNPDNDDLVDDLVGWFRADDALVEYGENGLVANWVDVSEFGNNATNTTVSQQPVVRGGVINGHAALQFDYSKKRQLFLPRMNFGGMSSFSNATFIAVASWSGKMSSLYKAGIIGLSLTNSTYDAYLQINKGGVLALRNGLAGNAISISAGLEANRWYGFGFESDSSQESPSTELILVRAVT